MYSPEEREHAVKLYIQYDMQAAKVIRKLGYPNRHSLVLWYKEYKENGNLHEKRLDTSKYTAEQRAAAVKYFCEHGENYTNTIKAMGYPSRQLLKHWLEEDAPETQKDCIHIGSHVCLPQKTKEEAVIALCAHKGSAAEIAKSYGVRRETLYAWRNELFPEYGGECM